MVYDLTGLENNTNILTVFTSLNTASGEWLVLSLLLLVFVISFISFKSYDTLSALRSSSFITSVLAVLFWSISLLSVRNMLIPVIFLGLIVFFSYVMKE